MEFEGVKIDVAALGEFGLTSRSRPESSQQRIQGYTDWPFNLNSPKQLGEVLFDQLKLADKPKKTKTGQYETDEQTLQRSQGTHPIIKDILDYREVTKLKSTYVDALPRDREPAHRPRPHHVPPAHGRHRAGWPRSDPEPAEHPDSHRAGPRDPQGLRVPEQGLGLAQRGLLADRAAHHGRAQRRRGHDRGLPARATTSTRPPPPASSASRLAETTPEMRRTAKMVNFGIIYGICAFGLGAAARHPARRGAEIIDQYFASIPGSRIHGRESQDARSRGYVRRSPAAAATSATSTPPTNHPRRDGAQRHQHPHPGHRRGHDQARHDPGSRRPARRRFKTRMLLQVHDELLFEVPRERESQTSRR